jgi:hypothetical protein
VVDYDSSFCDFSEINSEEFIWFFWAIGLISTFFSADLFGEITLILICCVY